MEKKSLNVAVSTFFNRARIGMFWDNVKEAIAGGEKDYTGIPLKKAIFLLAVPMILEMIMESVFAVVDIFFVSQISSGAVAVVGITESMITVVYSVAVGLSTATSALVARRTGEKDEEGASAVAVQGIIAGFLVSLVFSLIGIFFAEDLLRLMGTDPLVIESASTYTSVMLGGNTVIMLLFIINAVFRSSGDAAVSMRILWMANIINIVLDPCLIFGLGPFPELGVGGAAIATTIGRGIAVLCQLYILFRGNKRVKILRKHLKIKINIMKRLLKLSLGGIGQSIIAVSSWIFMVRIVAAFGSEVMAGYTIAIRIIIFSILPSWGLANAAATLVGQNLGAKKPLRAEKSVWITGSINTVLLGIIGLVFIFIPGFFISIFVSDPKVVKSGITCLRYISFGYLFYGYAMVLVQAFNGAGDTTTPTKINFFCFWLLEIPLAYFLAITLGWAEKGVSIAIVLAETAMAIAGFVIFKKGKWKNREV